MTPEKQAELSLLKTLWIGRQTMTPEQRERCRILRKELREEKIENLGRKRCEWLTELFYQHDPIQLVSFGVPKNEYQTETLDVLPKLLEVSSLTETHDALYECFSRMFGICTPTKEKFAEMAKEVWHKIENGWE